jgi:diguanylate cyclase (GGDEF)-like protein
MQRIEAALNEVAEQVKQGKENLRLSEATLHEVTEQVKQGKENLRLSEATLHEVTEQVKQGKENLHLSEVTLHEVSEQVKQGKESLRLSEAALQSVIEQAKLANDNLHLSEVTLHEVTKQANEVVETLRLSKNSFDEASENALHDPLTHLPNRILFSDRLKQVIYFSNRNDFYSALLFIDLDKFKLANDMYGHKFGDAILIEAALRLNNSVRDTDTVARIGGDEFTVILNDLKSDKNKAMLGANEIAVKIRKSLLSPYALDFDNKVSCCTASIGVILFKHDEISSENIVELADKAMYQAKIVGGNSIQFIDCNGNFY